MVAPRLQARDIDAVIIKEAAPAAILQHSIAHSRHLEDRQHG